VENIQEAWRKRNHPDRTKEQIITFILLLLVEVVKKNEFSPNNTNNVWGSGRLLIGQQ
jgi:hypothetical protein